MKCDRCGARHLVKNGLTSNGKQRYRCQNCGRSTRKNPTSNLTHPERKDEILRAYDEGVSQRAIARIFQVSRQSLTVWLQEREESEEE